ncbi:zinc-binding metallopeptidase family protein [Cohnella cholangitidis]|uniref:M28 family peptidase n=1 Tax=Cohnella cholangitidis TaxID=2598458 RepID=A0A7G5BS57_9BACL|nr:hypothetical protein [Cohnella cholangitidis]QMV39791.1 hypothetical protein FPL14_00155 [Cohnella cholangitidis]
MRSRVNHIFLLLISLLMAGNMIFIFSPKASASVSVDGITMIEEWGKKVYQGRQAGTTGYGKAVDDLEKRIRSVGMVPFFGDGQYRQNYNVGTANLTNEKVTLNNKSLKLMQDYMPYARSAAGKVTFRNAYYAGAGLSADYPSKVDGLVIFHWFDKNGKFPEGALDRIQRAITNGAKGVAIITNGELKVGNYEHPLSAEKLNVPVLYLSEAAANNAGVPRNFVPASLNKFEMQIDLSIDRSTQQADNLVGVIPGKSEEKAILWVTNIDGFGSLPDGTWFESAKSGAASAAMMLDMASYYKENVPEYTMIFAFVGSKWKAQEGIKALTEKIDFDRIALTIDLYAMGGNGKLDEMFINYTNPSVESFAQAVAKTPMLNNDLGNSLSSVLKTKANKLFLIRDRDTWVDDSLSDKAANISRDHYASGVESLITLSGRMMKRLLEEDQIPADYSNLPISKATFQNPKVTLNHISTRHYDVYADDVYIKEITPEVLKEMESIYKRVAKYNYYPLPQAKVAALFMTDGNMAAKISGRKELEDNSEVAGGGFANYVDGKMYIYMRSGPFYGTIAHELNHALASANGFAGPDSSMLQEWQGQSHFVQYLQPKGSYTNDIGMIIEQKFLAHHEVPKLRELVSKYKTELDWSWFTKATTNPNGHLYTYYLMGSMYTFLEDQYGVNVARRAMYRNYMDVSNIQNNLIQETGLSLNAFLEKWSSWMLQAEASSSTAGSAIRKPDNNGFDYMLLYTNPERKEEAAAPNQESSNAGKTITNGTVRYSLRVTSKDLKITSLNLYKTKDGASIEIAYESNANRFISLFNPPDGDKIKLFKANAIASGKGKAIVKLNNAEVKTIRNLPMITLRFGEGEDYAFVRSADYLKILK